MKSIIDPNRDYQRQTDSLSLIRFQDCDPLRHLNNAKYFDYFFNAREDELPKLYGIDAKTLVDTYQAGWVVYEHHISYLRPANLGERVRIISRVIHFDHNTVIVEYLMADESNEQLKTLLWTTLKYVGLTTGRTQDHGEALLDYLKAIQFPGVQWNPQSFHERVKEIKREMKLRI
jgi:acyl-CoA thioester hydrolase